MEGQPQAGPSQAGAFSSGWESEQAGDLEAAERSYRQAVEEGHTSAAIQLAFLVYDRDKEEMWRLLHWAAEQGSAAAAWSSHSNTTAWARTTTSTWPSSGKRSRPLEGP